MRVCLREFLLSIMYVSLSLSIQALGSYFSESEFQIMPPHPFQFAPPTTDEWAEPTAEPELEIRFPRQLPESGWRLVLESDHKVWNGVFCPHFRGARVVLGVGKGVLFREVSSVQE